MMLNEISLARHERRMGNIGKEGEGQGVGEMGKREGHESCGVHTHCLDAETVILKS